TRTWPDLLRGARRRARRWPQREPDGAGQVPGVPGEGQERTASDASPVKGTSTMRLVIIVGSVLIGSKLANRLREHGHETVPCRPDAGVNTLTGQGLAGVLQVASVVVDVSNSPSFEEKAVMDFFTTATQNILKYAAGAGVRHYVALSVVGTERIPDSPYLRAKNAQETSIKN